MRILALETSGMGGAVAFAEGEQLLYEFTLEPHQRTAQQLAPAISQGLASLGWQPADLQIVGVTAGPGSFTGLRVGVTTAKTFGYALKCDVVGVDTLEVLATQAPHDVQWICPIMDAQRKELFAATFQRDAQGRIRRVSATTIISQPDWFASLPSGAFVIGPGLKGIPENLLSEISESRRAEVFPSAGAVASVVWREHQLGRHDDPWKLAPLYLRASAAEEKAAKP